MTIEIPPELEWVSYLAGSEWPEGDEDAMFRIGGHWRNSADDLAKLIPDLNRVRQETIDSLSGDTATAADEQFKKLFDGDYSVDKLVDAMAAVGDMAWDQGTQIEYTKLQVLSTLAIVAAEIAWAIYNSWETLGASLEWIPTFEGFGIAVIRQIATAFLKRIRAAIAEAATKTFAVKALKMAGTGALHGIGIGLGQELAIQLYQESEGHRHDINWGQVGKVALGGAVGGGVGALAHGPLATAFGPSNSIVGKAVTGTAVAFGSGVAGGVGGALAAGGGLDGTSIFGGAAGGAGSGAVHGAAGHGGEVHPTGGGPDGGPVNVPPPKVDVPNIDIKPDDIGPDPNVPEPPPPYAKVDSPPPTSSTAGPSDGGQNSAVAPGEGDGSGQSGASQNGAGLSNGASAGAGQSNGSGQNSVAGQQNNGVSAGRGGGSGQSGASQNGAGQSNGASAGAGQSNGSGQNSGAGQQYNGVSAGQGGGSGQSGVSQNGAGQSNGASAGQSSGAGQQNDGVSAGQGGGSGQSGVSQNGAGQSNGASAGQSSAAGQPNNGAVPAQNNGSGQTGVSQNGAAPNNGASTGQSNGSGQSGVSQNGTAQNNGAAAAQNSGAGQPNNGSSTGQQSAQVGDGARPPGARPNAAGMDGRGPGAGGTQPSATLHTDTRPASAGTRNSASESNGGPNSTKAGSDSASDGPQSNSAARPPSTGKSDAGLEGSKSQAKDQPAVNESANPRTSPTGPPGNRRTSDGINSRPARTSDSSTPEKHEHDESNAPKPLFIGSSPHESSTTASLSDGSGHGGGTRASSPDVDPYRDGAGPSREEVVHSRPLPSPPDVVPLRDSGEGGGTRASSPDVDPHRDGAGPSREEQVHSRPLPSPPDVVPLRDGGEGGGTRASSPDVDPHRDGVRDGAGPSREEQVHSRPLPSPPDVVPLRDGGEGGGTRASSPDVDPHRDGAGPSREEVVHSRPLPSPPDVPVLAPLGGSNTSIHWIRSWIGDVNPGYDAAPVGDPRRRNCTSASLAVFHRLSGTSNDPAGLEELYSHQVTEITNLPLVPTTLDQVEQTLRDAGPGSHTIVAASFDGRPSHAFNAYFDGRNVHGLDGQSGIDEIWPPDSYIFHPAHPPTQLFMGTPFHGTREQLMRGNPDLSEGDSSSSGSGHDSGGPNRPSRAQIQGGHDPVSNHGAAQPFASGSGDDAMRPGVAGHTTSHGSPFAGTGGSHRSVPPGGSGDVHGSGTPARPDDTGAGSTGRDTRIAPIVGSDNGSGHRGGGARHVSGGDSGRGLKRGREDSGDGADGNADVFRHDKRARMDIDAPPEVADANRHSDTDMDVDHDDHHDPEAGSTRDTHAHTVDGDGDDGMDVDHVDHHDSAADESPNPHPHTDDGDDNMAVDHVDRPADDLDRRLRDLQDDEKTELNSKFEHLVNGAKSVGEKGDGGQDAGSTADNDRPGKGPYDDYQKRSVEEDRPIAFVVNAVVKAKPVPDLKAFVDAVMKNAGKDLDGKVAFVIGVNAENTTNGKGSASVDTALAEMKDALKTIDHPVALTGFTWDRLSTKSVPYGTMRNTTLHSEANKLAIEALWSKGNHPYIAVQDFDEGSRDVPSGKHIFNHVIDSMTVGDGWAPSRPLMFGGGYRTGDGNKLVDATLKHGGSQAVKKKIGAEGFVEDFERRITQDMDSRVVQAKTNPLLPYTPEPNLFVDAIATVVDPNVKFGNGAAEFSHLGEKLQETYAKELGKLHDDTIADIKKNIVEIEQRGDTPDARATEQLEELHGQIDHERSNLEVAAQNNRHPIRGEAFTTDFRGAAVETDLSRLAHDYATKGTVPQSHADLTDVANRFFATRDAKLGTSLSGYRDEFPNHVGERREPTNLSVDDGHSRKYTGNESSDIEEERVHVEYGVPNQESGLRDNGIESQLSGLGQHEANNKFKFIKEKTNRQGVVTDPAKTVEQVLGLDEGKNRINKSISTPVLSDDHEGVVAGIDPQLPEHKAFAAVNLAMSGPAALMQRNFGALDNFANLPDTLPPAEGGLFDTVGRLTGDNPTELRGQVTKYVSSLRSETDASETGDENQDTKQGKKQGKASPTKLPTIRNKLADFITDRPTTDGDLVKAIIQPRTPNSVPETWPKASGDIEPTFRDTLSDDEIAEIKQTQQGGIEEWLLDVLDKDQVATALDDGRREDVAQRAADAISATNAEHIAVKVLATKLDRPIRVQVDDKTTEFTPFGKKPSEWDTPITVHAVKQDNGRYTYSSTAPAPEPLAGGVGADYRSRTTDDAGSPSVRSADSAAGQNRGHGSNSAPVHTFIGSSPLRDGGEGGGTRASSPDVDPHRDGAGPSREEVVHSRPLPSPPDVPVLAPLGGSNTSIHWIRSWIGDVNPGYDAAPVGDPRRRNCTSASLAVFHRLSGTSNDPAGLEELYSHQVTEITNLPLVPTTLDQVEQTLRDAGPGSHTIVAASFDGRPSHAFNAYFDGRNVHGLDGQSGIDEIWPPDSYIFHPAHPPTQLFMGTPFHGTREQLMRGNPDLSEGDSSSSGSGHDSGGPNRPSRAQIQGGHDPVSNHGAAQPFASGSGDDAMRPGVAGHTTSHGSPFAGTGGSHRSVPPGGSGDVHGSGTPARPDDTGAGSTGRDTRIAPIVGSDNGSGHRGGGARHVSGGDSGRGLKRGREDSGDGADGNADVFRHDKRARMDIDAPPEVADANRHSDTDMDVDHDDHHDPEAGSTRDTHAHTVDGDDVVMADGTVRDQVDDLTRRLGDLQVDKETEFNSKFADLVSTAKGADSTAEDGEPGKDPYDGYVQTSVDENRPISIVVNTIVGADPVPDLKSFVDAVTNNAKDLHGKVAFVIGVNARNTPEGRASVDGALAEMKGALDTIDHPVALVRVPWSSSDLKYGTLRNNTMQSEANRLVTDALWSKGTHPYIAVQDFDTGSRNVPSGEHIFNHVIDSMTVGDGLPPSRPLMFGGGYRLGDDGRRNLVKDTEARRVRNLANAEDALLKIPVEKGELAAEKKKLEAEKKAAAGAKTVAKLTGDIKKIEKKIAKLNEESVKLTNDIGKLKKAKDKIAAKGFAEDFERRITQDMDTRVVLAKTNQLLPYTPEPNLFVDAIAIRSISDEASAKGKPGDGKGAFGSAGAEFVQLSKNLQTAYAKELGAVYDRKLADIDSKIAHINERLKHIDAQDLTDQRQDRAAWTALLKQWEDERDNQRSNLEVDAQNNRHPIRGEAFITDFKDGAVETDLSRLAYDFATKGKVSQSHADVNGALGQLFDSKPAKKGTSFAGFLQEFPNRDGEWREPANLENSREAVKPSKATAIPPLEVTEKAEAGAVRKYTPDPKLGNGEVAKFAADKSVAELLGLRQGRGEQGKLSSAISAPVPNHEGVTAGIDPGNLDHRAFAAVNTVMSGPKPLMQRNFGLLRNIADLKPTAPPGSDGLFRAVGLTETGAIELRAKVGNFVSLLSSKADKDISTELADFITDHPTTNGDLVNAIIQPGEPNAFVAPPEWRKLDVRVLKNENPDFYPESTQDAGKSGATADPNTGTDAEKDAEKKKQEADTEKKQREADAETATNAEHIASQILATTLDTPIHVQLDGETKKFTPFGKKPSEWDTPITVHAVKQASGRYTYSATAPARADSARPIRPAPTPSPAPARAHAHPSDEPAVVDPKLLHDDDFEAGRHQAPMPSRESPSEAILKAFGAPGSSLEQSFGAPGDSPANWLDQFSNPAEAPTADRGQQLIEARNAEERLEAGLSEGRQQIAQLSGRLEHVDRQIGDQHGVVEEANRRLAGAVDHLHRLQANERSIAEHGVDALARQHAADLTRTQLSAVQTVEERARTERNSLVQSENELAGARQHLQLFQQRLHEVEAELTDVGHRTIEAINIEQQLSAAVLARRDYITALRVHVERVDSQIANQWPVVGEADRGLAGASRDMQQLQDQAEQMLAHGADADTWRHAVEVVQGHQLLLDRARENAHAQRDGLVRLQGESAHTSQQLALNEQHLREFEVELANAGQRTIEARTLEQQLSATVLSGRDQIAEIGGRVQQLDRQVMNQRRVVEEADHRLADAHGVLHQLQTQERLIAERPVDENTRQRAAEQTQSQQRVAGAEQERALEEHDSLERLRGESALMRQQLAHDEQRLAEIEVQLSRARQDTAELARPQVVSRERFPEHSLEAIRLFRDNYPQLRDLNAVHFNAGVQDHMHNCVNVVVSTFETLSGRRMVPHGAPSGRSGELLIEHFDREHHMVSGPQEIVETLVQAGPGSHGVVFQHRAQGEGHVFNALYDERLNSVVFIDAQNGRLGSFDPNDRYGFMLVTGDDPHVPRPMDVDTAFGGPKVDFPNVSHESLTKNNVGNGFGDNLDGRHRSSAEGNSHKRRFEPDEDSTLRGTATGQPNESSGRSAPPTRSSLSGVPSAGPSPDSSGAPVARTADAGADEGVSRPTQPDVRKPDPQLPARIGDHLVLGGTDVLEEFRSGEEGARDQGFEYIKRLVLREGGEEVWQKNEMDVYGLFSDRGLRPQVPGMLRGGQTVKHVIHLAKNRSLTVELRLDGADDRSKLGYPEEFKDEFEHTSDSTSSVGRSVQSRVVYHAGIQGSVSHSAASDTSALIASRAHDSGLTEVRTDRQISGAQTAEKATRFSGRIQASIVHRFSDSPKVVHEHELAYHTQVAVPTRDVNDRGADAPPSELPAGPTAPPRVEYTRALSGSDVVTNLWLLPDQQDSAQQPKHDDAGAEARIPRGPRPQKIPEFVMDTPMRTAFEKAYGKGSAHLAIEEAGKWLTVERLQANLHGMTNKQPLVLELESIPGARLEVHAFVEPLGTASDTKSAAGDGDVTNPKSAQPMMHATGETNETEFHFGTETDTSQVRQDAVTVTYQTPVPGRARGEGGTDTGEATDGIDANVTHGNVHSETESRQFRIRSTLKNAAPGQAWHGQARLRFVMHAPDAVSPAHLDAPFKGAVHETRARFDVLAEKSETTPTQDYTDQTVYAPPERIWGNPPGERNSVAKSPWWRIGAAHRTARTQDGGTRSAYEPAPASILRGERTAQLRGLGSMDRVTNLDVSGLHGMLDSMGRRAFGNDWSNVRSEVSSWHHLNRIRAALPAMTQHSPLTRTKLSGPNSKTKVSFTADIEELTYKRTIKTLSSPSMEITEGSASTTERNGQLSVQAALGGKGGDVNGGSVLGEAMAGATETVRDSERVRDQQRVAVGTKFDQPMAIFEGWVRLDGTMTGSKSTVHESGLFPVEIAIPLTELQGSRTHGFKLPPTFTRESQTGFIDEPRPKPPRDPVDQAPQPKNPFAPKSMGHEGGEPPLLGPPVPPVVAHDGEPVSRVSDDTVDSRTPLLGRTRTFDSARSSVSESKPGAAEIGLNDAADSWKQLPPVKFPPPEWKWTKPETMKEPPELPAHARMGSWHPSDMLIGLDPASGLLEAMRHDLAPALGSSLDDAVDSLANQFGPRVLAARLTHQSGQAWSHDIPVAGGTITVKVRSVRESENAKYVGTSSKFETDLSIESQSSAAQGHGASLRTNEGFRVQIPIPHGSVSFGGQHTGSVRPNEDPEGARLSGLNTPTYTGEIEHRVPVRTRATEAHDLFRQPIRFEISYERQTTAKLLKDIPKSPQMVRLNGVFSYPKKTPTAVDSENAGPPPEQIEVQQAVVKIRPHGSASSTADADSRRTADEDQMATHILESMAERGKEIFGKKWPSVRAELTKHVKMMAIQAKLGDYTRGQTKTINLTSVRGGKVVLGAHLDTMRRADSNATTEFYSGGQQLLTAGVSKSRGNNWQGFIQAQADLLPTGDTVNVSALARLGGGVGSETQDTRTNNTATGTLFRKKVPTETHVGAVTINAAMSRPGGDGRVSGVGSAKVEFVTRESPTDKQAHAYYVPRDGIIQNETGGAASRSDEQRGQDDADLPRRGLSDKSIVRKLVDGENFRGVTLERLHERKIKDAGEVVDGLTDTLVASKLGDMTRVDNGDGIQLVRHGNVRIYGRAAVQALDFARIEHEGGNAYVLNDVNQTRLDQHTSTLEGNARLMFGPHGELAPGVSASLLAGGGVGGRRRVDAISSQAARVAANEKFARSHAVFDGTTRIILTVRDGETRHELEPINVHGRILIPESETHAVDPPPPSPTAAGPAPKEDVPEEFWLGALAAQWAGSWDEPAPNPPRASLSAESHLSRIPAGSPIARTVVNTPDVSRP